MRVLAPGAHFSVEMQGAVRHGKVLSLWVTTKEGELDILANVTIDDFGAARIHTCFPPQRLKSEDAENKWVDIKSAGGD